MRYSELVLVSCGFLELHMWLWKQLLLRVCAMRCLLILRIHVTKETGSDHAFNPELKPPSTTRLVPVV